jgi:hypothetical protein
MVSVKTVVENGDQLKDSEPRARCFKYSRLARRVGQNPAVNVMTPNSCLFA